MSDLIGFIICRIQEVQQTRYVQFKWDADIYYMACYIDFPILINISFHGRKYTVEVECNLFGSVFGFPCFGGK